MNTATTATATTARARAAFLRACEWDVAVRKPGNVSDASPGHGMQAALFRASAQAAAGPLFAVGARVGERIEGAVAATGAVAGCNTNLGILLLCAPLAVAAEQHPEATTPHALQAAVQSVLHRLDVHDTRAAYRAITQANPGGLGSAPDQDVHAAPTLGLRDAMALAAARDRIAQQYSSGFEDLFSVGLPALLAAAPGQPGLQAGLQTPAAVQRLYLTLLAAFPDSHIVRKQGPAMAQTVMQAAQPWLQRLVQTGADTAPLADDPAFIAWDDSLKATGTNPGTTADLTVATLMVAGLLGPAPTG